MNLAMLDLATLWLTSAAHTPITLPSLDIL